jgi:hypothetical protein
MPSESQTWSDHVKPVLEAHRLDPKRVENAVALGMPDVNYIEGWIELKYVADWPKREETPLRLGHFTPQQRVWLYRRWVLGGKAFLLLRVAKEFLLFDGRTACDAVGLVSRASLYDRCLRRAPTFNDPVLLSFLTRPRG